MKRLAILLLSLLLSGCAASAPKIPPPQFAPPETRDPAPPELALASLPRVSVPASDPNIGLIQELMDRAAEAFEKGEQLLREGRIEEGNRELRRAVDLIENSPFSILRYPQLGAFYKNLVRDAGALEAAFAEEQEGDGSNEDDKAEQDLEPAAVDALPGINLYRITVDPSLVSKLSDDLRNKWFGIPIPLNDRVFRMLEYYQSRARDIAERGLAESGKYLPLFCTIFEEAGVPVELVHVAQVESLYRPLAYSRARARGIWQFIRPTAREHLLKVNRWLDERSDIEKSARAAAGYLKELYEKFADWHLALAAYNWGPGRIERLQARYGPLTYWDMADRRLLPAETENYVPSVLATIIIASNPERYGFQVAYARPLEFEKINVGRSVRLSDVARTLGVELQVLKALNPELVRLVTPRDDPEYQLKVPLGAGQELADQLARLPEPQVVPPRRYRIRRGDTLGGIARRFGVPVRDLAEVNHLSLKSVIRENAFLVIPGAEPDGAGDGDLALASGQYRVRRGDTLSGIARRTGVSMSRLRQLNRLDARATLRVGQILELESRRAAVVTPPRRGTSQTQVAARDGSGRSYKVVHQVRRGDTIGAIAKRYGTDVASIRQWNPSVVSLIYPGQRLTIFVSR